MFDLLLTKNFSNELKKPEIPIKKRIKKKLQSTIKDPFKHFERMKGMAFFKYRVGKYRIIASINPSKKQITLLSVSLRKAVYSKFKNKQ